jgi:M6 family metalloprotease-like protein
MRIKALLIIFLALLITLSSGVLPTPSSGKEHQEMKKTVRTGEKVEKGLVILVEFPDIKPTVRRDFVETRFSKHLNNYFTEMSYQKVSLDIEVTQRWYTLPKSVNQYSISPRNLEVDRNRVRGLINDALEAVDKDFDISKYSFIALFLGAKAAEYGMVGLCGYPGMLGWGTESVLQTQSGRRVKGGVAIFCFHAHLGTLFHDIGHILGGVKDGKRMVPCLYDHDLQAKPGPNLEVFRKATVNMGFWDPMSCHFYKRELPPPGLSSWTKMRLNWIDHSKIKVIKPGQEEEIVLGPLEEVSSQILSVKIPVSPTTYYLIENRQPLGFDQNLPGRGVLIMVADDNVAECRFGRAPVKLMNANPSIPYLEGAAFDIGGSTVFQDDNNKIKIRLKEKIGQSYKILISYKKFE